MARVRCVSWLTRDSFSYLLIAPTIIETRSQSLLNLTIKKQQLRYQPSPSIDDHIHTFIP
jgi:hypothetical protein